MPVRLAKINTDQSGLLQAHLVSDDDVPFRLITKDQFRRMHLLYSTTASCRAAHAAYTRGVFYGRMSTRGIPATPVIQYILDSVLPVFGTECLLHLKIYGFVIVTLNVKTKRPAVIDPLQCMVEHRITNTGESEYRISNDTMVGSHGSIVQHVGRTVRKDVIVFEDHPPDAFGVLDGDLRGLLRMSLLSTSILGWTRFAAERMACPAAYVIPAAIKDSDILRQADTAFAGQRLGSVAMTDEQQNMLEAQRLRREQEFLRPFRERAGKPVDPSLQFLGTELDPATDVMGYPSMSAHQIRPPEFVTMPGDTVQPAPPAQTPPSFVEIHTEVENEVAKVWGVPPALWGASRSSIATVETLLNTMYTTLQQARRDVFEIFRYILIVAFGDLQLRMLAHLREYVIKHEGVLQMLNEDIDITFSAFMDPPMIRQLNADGLLTWSVYRRKLADYYGMAYDDLTEEPFDPITQLPVRIVAEQQKQREERLIMLPIEAKAAADAAAARGTAAGTKRKTTAGGAASSAPAAKKPKASAAPASSGAAAASSSVQMGGLSMADRRVAAGLGQVTELPDTQSRQQRGKGGSRMDRQKNPKK